MLHKAADRVAPMIKIDSAVLSSEIVNKAEGVWGWVYLVVGILINHIDAGSKMSELWQELSKCPRELKDLYTRILEKIRPEWIPDTINYLQIVCIRSPWPLEEFSLAVLDPSAALSWKPPKQARGQIEGEHFCFELGTFIQKLCESTNLRIQARGGGLLQVSTCRSMKEVHFLHLTVKDYVSEKVRWAGLISRTDQSRLMDPYTCLMALELRLLHVFVERSELSLWLPFENSNGQEDWPPSWQEVCNCADYLFRRRRNDNTHRDCLVASLSQFYVLAYHSLHLQGDRESDTRTQLALVDNRGDFFQRRNILCGDLFRLWYDQRLIPGYLGYHMDFRHELGCLPPTADFCWEKFDPQKSYNSYLWSHKWIWSNKTYIGEDYL